MRWSMVLVVLAACGVDQVDSSDHSVVIIPVGSDGSAAMPATTPNYKDACDQLVATDDALCGTACTDWAGFAAMAKPGTCVMAECPLQDGSTFSPSVCLDPH